MLLIVVVCALLFFLPNLTDRKWKKSDNQEQTDAEIKDWIHRNNQGPHM
ncbi:hypothetical protein [Listeria rustica]|uniref:Uncharacterized protein n=1 Tax=Listeria rustica TaxID=2713503 RepID=A0A7W1T5B9_9LIST|nr:hypothetical protein [Listeria rustica]MBA3925783.1 hypothetical protein [Listeria rustica]